MIRKKVLHVAIGMLLLHTQMAAQQPGATGLENYFSQAYEKYPTIPKGVLEAAAYSASHMSNLRPDESNDPANCMGMPQRFGLFGLVEDGRGYFKNNLTEICRLSNISPAQFKKDVALQIMAVAKFLGEEAGNQRLAVSGGAERFAGVLEKLSEIPDDGNAVNAYARSLYTYDIYTHLQRGVASPLLKTQPVHIQLEKIYPAKTLRTLQAPGVKIDYDRNSVVPDNGPAANNAPLPSNVTARVNSAEDIAAVQSTDYPPALWDEAHTNNWAVGRAGTAITNVTIHTMEGSYSGTISWFNNGNQIVNGVHVTTSAHYLVRSSDGQITQMVRDADRAFHVLSANYYTIGIEHEGFVADASWYTDNMYNASAALVRDICSSWTIDKSACFPGPATSTVNFQPITVRIKGHQHYSGNTHTDPGINWNWPKYAALINPPVLPSTRIAFTIKDQSTGAAVASATAVVTKPNGTTSTLTTNASGVLVFGADSGRYTFSFSKSGYNTLSTFFVGGGADDSIAADINLDAAGTVVPANEPATIRVVTSCACGTTCSTVQLQVMSLEAYVQTGLDDEWLSSWNAPSLQAGAVAYRSRGAWYVQHPVANNYDISSATCHQTWQNDRATSVKNAAIATAGVLLVKNGAIVKADYSAENNNAGCGDGFSGNGSTWPCISDARCAGRTNNGSGKGMCQWGSSFWGTDQTYTWILNHYYGPDSITIQMPATAAVINSAAKISDVNTAADNLKLSPNPVTGSEVTVEYTLSEVSQDATIILFGSYGEVIQQRRTVLQTGYNRLTLNTGALKAGMYTVIIRFNANGKTVSKRLVVVK